MLTEALRLSKGTGPRDAELERMASIIEAGGSVKEAFASLSRRLPVSDRLVIVSAAAAGRLPLTLHALSERHAQLGAAKLRAALACIYPLGILHIGLLLLPLAKMIDWEKGFMWNPIEYATGVALSLIPLWTILSAGALLLREDSAFIESIVSGMPIIGRYRRMQARSDFAFTLANSLEAGVEIGQAWKMAARASCSPGLRKAGLAVVEIIKKGTPPGRLLEKWRVFSSEFVALYRTGETSGQLEKNLLRISALDQEQALRSLKLATIVFPGILFLIVAGGVAYFVITIYGGYLKMLSDLAGQ